jgi:hypothetical protein
VPLSASLLLEHRQAVSILHVTLLLPLESYDAQPATDLVATLDAFCRRAAIGASPPPSSGST